MRDQVRSGYADIARSGTLLLDEGKEEFGGGCCGPAKAPLTHAFLAGELGYTEDELKALPEGANMGLSCGNPTAIANLKPGQVVLDLGSGGGFDCFLAGPKVGPEGRVIGVDMTPEMLSKARTNIASYRETTGLDNVEFRLGEIEHLPVADASVDVIISNCVINLSPDKPQVWREVTRVLRPGGRIVASDIALIRPLPENVQAMVEALIGCVSGAVLIDTYREMVTTAGLREVELRPKPEYVAALESFQDPLYRRIAENLPAGTKPADYITSIDVTAVR
ncbi:MAG: arsenite methyltransferase [Planctomycetota bacterium]